MKHNAEADEKSSSKFKVVDKRRFTTEGEAKEQEVEEAHSKKTDTKQVSADEKNADVLGKINDFMPRPPLDFAIFVQSLGHQAFMAMGLIPWPDTGLVKANIEQAKETIDILGILKEKTSGNLNDSENKLLESLLYELRMMFVQMSSKACTLK